MTPQIVSISSKTLVGMSLTMSLAQNRTGELFRALMPRKREILNAVSADVFDVKVYPSNYFASFNPENEFTKWAAIETSSLELIPSGMQTFTMPGGLYAVFRHKGAEITAQEAFQFIFSKWLPHSSYELDDRPHFDVLGPQYRNGDPNSEEDIWIPVKPKAE